MWRAEAKLPPDAADGRTAVRPYTLSHKVGEGLGVRAKDANALHPVNLSGVLLSGQTRRAAHSYAVLRRSIIHRMGLIPLHAPLRHEFLLDAKRLERAGDDGVHRLFQRLGAVVERRVRRQDDRARFRRLHHVAQVD